MLVAKRALSAVAQTSSSSQSGLFRPDQVLGEKNRKDFIGRFQRYKTKTGQESAKRNDESQAAVLVPLCIHEGQVGLLYTLRSRKLNVNRGQVCFPGGMHDKTDLNLEDTALRETWEELGIPREKVNVWTSGDLIGKKNVRVLPVVGYIGDVEPAQLRVNTDEVEEAFFVGLKELCDPSHCRSTQFRTGGPNGHSYTLPSYVGGKHRIWGFTGAITHMVLNSLVPEAYKHRLRHIVPVLSQRDGHAQAHAYVQVHDSDKLNYR